MPPRTSQVSLPSQIGAIEFMTRLREARRARSRKDAHAQIEAVEQHVEEHADAEDHRPDRNKIEDGWLMAASRRGAGSASDRMLRPAAFDRLGSIARLAARAHDRDHQREAGREHHGGRRRNSRASESSDVEPVSDGDTESAVRSRP